MEKVEDITITPFTSVGRPKLNLNLKANSAGCSCALALLDTVKDLMHNFTSKEDSMCIP